MSESAAEERLGAPEDGTSGALLAETLVPEFDVTDVTLDQATAILHAKTGIEFRIDGDVRERVSDLVIPGMNHSGSTLHEILRVLLGPYGLRSQVREDVVWIVAEEELDGPMYYRTYAVGDLDGLGPRLAGVQVDADVVRNEVYPRYWEYQRSALVRRTDSNWYGPRLEARASGVVLEGIAALLRRRRQALRPIPVSQETGGILGETRVELKTDAGAAVGDVLKSLQIQTGFNLSIDPHIRDEVQAQRLGAFDIEQTALTSVLLDLARAVGADARWVVVGNRLVLTSCSSAGEQ